MLRVCVVQPVHIHAADAARVLAERAEVERVGEDDAADAWLIYGRTSQRAALVQEAARRGVAMFVEKPLAVDPEDARRIAARLDARSQIGFFLRYWPALAQLRLRLHSGELGAVRRIRARFVHGGWATGWFAGGHAWMADPAEGGGGFFDLAVHCLDAIAWLAGPIARVDACDLASAHHGTARLDLEHGGCAELEAGWEAPAPDITLDVETDSHRAHAVAGRLVIDDTVVLDDDPPSAHTAIATWLDHLAGRPRAPLVDPHAAVRNAELLHALRLGAAG